MTLLNKNYNISIYRNTYNKCYSASGILLYRVVNNKTEILLGYDIQKKGYTVPGGKREFDEYLPIDTAKREFFEETGGILTSNDINLIIHRSRLISFNKYILFMVCIDTEEKFKITNNIEEEFKTFVNSDRYLTSLNTMKEMSCVKWVSVYDLINNKIPITGLLRKFFYNYHVKKAILQNI